MPAMDASDDRPLRACIRRDVDRRALERASLVLSATDVEHAIEADGGEWSLWVAEADAQRARRELDAYARENRARPSPRPVVDFVENGVPGVLAFLSVLWLLPSLEAAGTFGWNWLSIGTLDAGRVMSGEWWRTITALTLHADLGHLVANSLFGAVFGLLVGRHFGSGFGWLLVLACGALGNAIDASLQAPDFRSIGASTATFAAIGLVGAFVWRRGYYRTLDWRRSIAPIFAAIALLAYTGVSGENVDVVAHVAGFATGAAFGAATASFDMRRIAPRVQAACGVIAASAIALAWLLAGRAH